MTQPQAPFGQRCAAWPACEEAGWVRRNGACQWCARAAWNAAPLRETAETVDAAELLKRQAAQIGALQVRVGVQDARIAALDDDCRRLRAEVERLGQAQAV